MTNTKGARTIRGTRQALVTGENTETLQDENPQSFPCSATETLSRQKQQSLSWPPHRTNARTSSRRGRDTPAVGSRRSSRHWDRAGCLESCESRSSVRSRSAIEMGQNKTTCTRGWQTNGLDQCPRRDTGLPRRRLCVPAHRHAPARVAAVTELRNMGRHRGFRQGQYPSASLLFRQMVVRSRYVNSFSTYSTTSSRGSVFVFVAPSPLAPLALSRPSLSETISPRTDQACVRLSDSNASRNRTFA